MISTAPVSGIARGAGICRVRQKGREQGKVALGHMRSGVIFQEGADVGDKAGMQVGLVATLRHHKAPEQGLAPPGPSLQ